MARYKQVKEILEELEHAGTSARLSDKGRGAFGIRTASQSGDAGLTAPYSHRGIDSHLPGIPGKASDLLRDLRSRRSAGQHSAHSLGIRRHCDDFSTTPSISTLLPPRDDYDHYTTAAEPPFLPNAPQESRPDSSASANHSYFCSGNNANYWEYPSPSRMSRLILDLKILACFLGIVATIAFVIWDLVFK